MKCFPKKLTLTWIKSSYHSKELVPEELIEEIIKRVKECREKNIWITEPSMDFIKPYIDRLPKQMSPEYPLWGIPFAIKDNIDLKSIPTTAACEAYAYVPRENATVVEKLIKAGAIPVGKTNLDQFATGLVGTRSPYGEVHNALNPELISGGSSSGSAVSVALGMAAFSLGTDTAGSGRVPAALNGLVGYKPPLGAWSTKGVVPACASLDCVTVFANSIKDAGEVNMAVRGFDQECCWSKEYREPSARLPKKIYLSGNPMTFYGTYAKIYEEKWNQAVKRLKSMDIKVEYINDAIFWKAASILYEGPWVAERWRDLGEFVTNHSDKVFPVTEKILKFGSNPTYTAAKLFGAMHELQKYRMETKKLLKDAVLIMPTAGGTFTREEVRKNPIETNSQMGLYTNHCNLLDMCAVAFPTKKEETKYPFGITIFGLADSEDLILGTAEKFLAADGILKSVLNKRRKIS